MNLSAAVDDGAAKKMKKDRREKSKENKAEVMKKFPKKRGSDGATRRWVQPILLDPSGRPVFPIGLDGLTVYSLGEIVSDRSSFHDKAAIYPVGFCSTRVYVSMRSPEQKCLYTCQIKDGWSGPQFEIVPEDDPQNSIIANSAADCHAALLKSIGAVRGTHYRCPGEGGGILLRVHAPHDTEPNTELPRARGNVRGTLDLPEIHAAHDYISTYQMFLAPSQLSREIRHLKSSPGHQYSAPGSPE
ncbi:unnamed protein product [Ranitomeya imitator]|uniref:Transforming growth factor beta regulator 1 n=1 Tax=Ranitomeya imitator TaxID=111125 RepID=A0ABN9LZ78_9NEOB|nr:unnamed protein product [Ranitomeya imitator]